MYKENISWRDYKLPWRNWLARSAVNRKVGGSSPPGSVGVVQHRVEHEQYATVLHD